jgi:HlyD family secretion protein
LRNPEPAETQRTAPVEYNPVRADSSRLEVQTEIPVKDRERQEAPYRPPPADDFPVRPRSKKRARAAVWAAVLLLLFGGAAALIARRARAKPEVHYDTADVDRGTIAAKVTATGNLSAVLTVQVGSQVSGRVQQLFVDYNSPVKKGQTVAKLDPLLFDAAVQQARATYLSIQGNLNKDQAQANNAKLIYDRTKTLVEAKVMSQSDLDTASANNEAAKAQVEADKSNLESAHALMDQAEVNRGYTTIVSPIDGIVISRNVDVGQTVAASFQSPTLFVIAQDLRHMQVDTNVGEADVGRLTAGMPATFTVDAYPGRPFTGRLRQIRNAAQTIQNVVTYDAVIDVENPSLLLKPGMTANVVFIAAQKDSVLRVRNAALRFQPDLQLLARVGVKAPAPNSSPPAPGRRTVWVLRRPACVCPGFHRHLRRHMDGISRRRSPGGRRADHGHDRYRCAGIFPVRSYARCLR